MGTELPKCSQAGMQTNSSSKVPESSQTGMSPRTPSKVPKRSPPRVPERAEGGMHQNSQRNMYTFLPMRSLRTAHLFRTKIINRKQRSQPPSSSKFTIYYSPISYMLL